MAAAIARDSSPHLPSPPTAPGGHFWSWRGQAIHYVRADTGTSGRPPLLLVHGFGASTDHWRKNVQTLQADFAVWAIDLLGFGRSAKPDLTYSGTLWRDQLHDFITTVIGQPVVLVGNSLGGYVSLCLAADFPEAVAGVVLLNSAGPFQSSQPTPPPQPLRRFVGQTLRSLLLHPLPSWLLFQYVRRRSTIRKTLLRVYLDPAAVTDRLVEDIRRPAEEKGAARVFAAVFKAPRGESVDAMLSRMRAPLLLLWGEADPWMDTRQRSAQFRQHYALLTEHFLAAGHCPHDEVPEQVNALIRTWVEQQVETESLSLSSLADSSGPPSPGSPR